MAIGWPVEGEHPTNNCQKMANHVPHKQFARQNLQVRVMIITYSMPYMKNARWKTISAMGYVNGLRDAHDAGFRVR